MPKHSLYKWAALAGLAAALAVPAACGSAPKDRADAAIAAAREANEAALAACVALEERRSTDAKLDAFCAELQTHANTLERLDNITQFEAPPAPDAGGGTGGAR